MKKTLAIATLLLTTAAQAQVPRQPQDAKEWNDISAKRAEMFHACANVPDANLAAQSLPPLMARLEELRQALPRIEERLEFCQKRRREIAEQQAEKAKYIKEWNDMLITCEKIPRKDLAAIGIPETDFNPYRDSQRTVEVWRQLRPHILEGLEFCQKRKRENAEQQAEMERYKKEWDDMVRTCESIPGKDRAALGLSTPPDNLEGWRQLRPRVLEGPELCRKRKLEIAEGKTKKESETKKSLDELLQKRDPSDMVAQILNYAFTGSEHGLEGDDGNFGGSYYYPQWVFFIKESRCVYRRIAFTKIDELVRREDTVLDLSKYDPRLFDFKEKQDADDNGNQVTKYELLYDGKTWNSTVRPLSIERLRRGWPLIYSKYCTGSQLPF
jgi:hypothetical protein